MTIEITSNAYPTLAAASELLSGERISIELGGNFTIVTRQQAGEFARGLLALATPKPAAKPCSCPNDAEESFEGVWVPHTVECPQGEPRRYTYQIEGEIHVGTLADYANAWEQGHYAGVEVGGELRTWDASYHVKVEYLGTENDWMRHRLTVDGETVFVNIDGRA